MRETKEKIFTELLYKIEKEQKEYKERIAKLPPQKIIEKAYEIYHREEIASILEFEEFDEDALLFFLSTPYIIDVLYTEWLDADCGVTEMLTDFIQRCVE